MLSGDRPCASKTASACDAGKHTPVGTYFANFRFVLARISVHSTILAKKKKKKKRRQIQNQHLRFAQKRSNDPNLTYALAEIIFR